LAIQAIRAWVHAVQLGDKGSHIPVFVLLQAGGFLPRHGLVDELEEVEGSAEAARD
jgi:hypothetical protein